MLNDSNLQVQLLGVENDGGEVEVWLREMGAMQLDGSKQGTDLEGQM